MKSCRFRDALATRVYTLRILDEFLPQRYLIGELREFDDLIFGTLRRKRKFVFIVLNLFRLSVFSIIDNI